MSGPHYKCYSRVIISLSQLFITILTGSKNCALVVPDIPLTTSTLSNSYIVILKSKNLKIRMKWFYYLTLMISSDNYYLTGFQMIIGMDDVVMFWLVGVSYKISL